MHQFMVNQQLLDQDHNNNNNNHQLQIIMFNEVDI